MTQRESRSLARRLRLRNNLLTGIPSAILLVPFSERFPCDSLVPMVPARTYLYYYYESTSFL